MAREGLDAFLVPRTDPWRGEWVAPSDERLAWLTGFTGSAGLAAVTSARAALFVDGRYRLQARAQTDPALIEVVDAPPGRPEDWLAAALEPGARIGFDPWLHSVAELRRLEKALAPRGIALVPAANLIDRIWSDRPARPASPAEPWPERYAGASAAEKRARIGAALAEAGEAGAVLTLPDSICWLLNIRGRDVPRTPVLHAFALIDARGRVTLWTEPERFDAALRAALGPEVEIRAPGALPADLAARAAALGGPVRIDPAACPEAIRRALAEAAVPLAEGEDPCQLPKACKTAAEIAATREAHLRDGAAMVRFLAWLEPALAEVAAGRARLTEIDIVRRLEAERVATGELVDLSFETICGAGPNGALPHYRVTEASNRAVAPGDLIVIDSGGQYRDGTTDVTRTLACGTPPPEARAAFTRVLRGMIAVSRLRWPEGLAGRDLDPFARAALWAAGLDYDHGTGHGVGVFLSVHEGPQRLSRLSEVPLQAGMILSNEPGYYREGAFGIRIENLVVVTPPEPIPGGDAHRPMHGFDTLTWVPISRDLIEPALLSAEDRDWLDGYHAEVRRRLAPRLDRPEDAAARAWLERATAPLGT
ncbi:MAG: aminopeptidase P family protein [Alphaproteobacteria bacterium]|nr:MAG: aminopeptidase P family protein [Alphaproteobacteria bacterium]